MSRAILVPLEKLHRALVLLRRVPRLERAEVTALAGLRVLFARVEAVLAGFQLADHLSDRCNSGAYSRNGSTSAGVSLCIDSRSFDDSSGTASICAGAASSLPL